MTEFVMNSFLFGNSQTFIGVLITLIVLCLFNDKSNFILGMISILNKDMETYLNKCLDALKESKNFPSQPSLPKNGAYSYDYWIERLDERTKQKWMKIENDYKDYIFAFHNKSQSFINQYKEEINRILNRHELIFIEIHLFINSLILMAIDGCCTISVGWNCFVCILTFMSVCYSCFLWYHYIKNTEQSMTEEIPEKFVEKNSCLMKRCLKHIVGLIVYGLICMSFLCFTSGMWTYIYLLCVLFLTFFICYKHCDKMLTKLNHYRYTNSLVIKHTAYQLFTAFIVAVVVKTFTTFDYLHTWACNGHVIIQKWTEQWEENIMLIFNHSYIGSVYAVYLLTACFIAPFFIGYFMNRWSSRKALLGIQKEREIVKRKIEDYQKKYYELIDDFIGKEKQKTCQ